MTNTPPRSVPVPCTKKLTKAAAAARHSTMLAMSRTTGRACEVRSVNQTVAS